MVDFIYHIEIQTGGSARTTPMRANGLDCIDCCAGASAEVQTLLRCEIRLLASHDGRQFLSTEAVRWPGKNHPLSATQWPISIRR